MHNLILGKRNAGAQQRILSASALLAEHFEIDPALVTSLKVQEKDPLVRAMKEREAVAALLDEISLKLGLQKPAKEVQAEDATQPAVTPETGEGLPAPVLEGESAGANDEKPKRRRGKKSDGEQEA